MAAPVYGLSGVMTRHSRVALQGRFYSHFTCERKRIHAVVVVVHGPPPPPFRLGRRLETSTYAHPGSLRRPRFFGGSLFPALEKFFQNRRGLDPASAAFVMGVTRKGE